MYNELYAWKGPMNLSQDFTEFSGPVDICWNGCNLKRLIYRYQVKVENVLVGKIEEPSKKVKNCVTASGEDKITSKKFFDSF